ncbi:flagellar motor protein MotB [Candidatus Omnitrophota bacterium]
MRKNIGFFSISILLLLAFAVSGCAVGFYKGRPSDIATIDELKDELARLKEAKSLLESRLKKEIDSDQVTVNMEDRGLVITFLAEILFDSGKDKVTSEGEGLLLKVSRVIMDERIENYIGIEGHTDNEPIKHSGWKSNWELSTARATSVLHFLVDDGGFAPEKLSATGYGEYRPLTTNETPEGRQQNRRVEIIIKPEEIAKPIRGGGISPGNRTQNEGYIK